MFASFSVVGLELVLSQRLQLLMGYSPLHAALFVDPYVRSVTGAFLPICPATALRASSSGSLSTLNW